MKLNKLQSQRAGEWLMAKAPGLKCPGCGGNDWHVDEHMYLLVSPPDPPGAGIMMARDLGSVKAPAVPIVSPCVTVMCTHCACIQVFGAKAMGLLGPPCGQWARPLTPTREEDGDGGDGDQA